MPREGIEPVQASGDTWHSEQPPRLPGHLEPVGGVFYLITSMNLLRFLLVLLFLNISVSLLPSAACCDEVFHHLIMYHVNSHICLFET